MANRKVTVINGPNLDLLGIREPEIYGSKTLDELNRDLSELALSFGISYEFFQSNFEGAIIDKINKSHESDAIIINACGYSHTSIAIMDSLKAYPGYKIEVHISNIYAREEFRRHSYISSVVNTVVSGAGIYSYSLALFAANEFFKTKLKH